ncbi:DUF3887 domain-containing protein [Planctomycetales bacterium ZRK34]|nr:DUF3887 domain-containing protein [Planctomycetales bacterium ZRK34]
MLPRALEVLLIILLVVITLGVAFQYRNHQLLQQILNELRQRPQPVAIVDENPKLALGPQANAPASTTPPPANPAQPNIATANPAPEPVDTPEVVNTPSSTPEPTPLPDTSAEPTPAAKPAEPAPKPKPAPVKPADTPASPEWDQAGTSITRFAQNLLNGKYDAVVKQFDTHMASNLPKAQLAAVMDPIRKQHGGYSQITGHDLKQKLSGGMNVFNINVQFTSGHELHLTVTLDQNQRIAGLMMN